MSTLICNKAYISMGCKEAERKLGSTDDVDYLYTKGKELSNTCEMFVASLMQSFVSTKRLFRDL